jgi:hypothetical protein
MKEKEKEKEKDGAYLILVTAAHFPQLTQL